MAEPRRRYSGKALVADPRRSETRIPAAGGLDAMAPGKGG
jgi:hypothetical protein